MKLFPCLTFFVVLVAATLLTACGGQGATPPLARPDSVWEIYDSYKVAPKFGSGHLLEVQPTSSAPEYFGNKDVVYFAAYLFSDGGGNEKTVIQPYLNNQSSPHLDGYSINQVVYLQVFPVNAASDAVFHVHDDAAQIIKGLCQSTPDCQ